MKIYEIVASSPFLAPRSRVRARLASLAQIGELARRLPVRRLLSHSKTKNELSSYLDYAMETNLRAFVAWGYHAVSCNTSKVNHLQSEQEEVDTKMLLHALDATANGAT